MTISKIINDGIGSITGDLTVDTDTLVVDSTNNRVGIGTSSPSSKTSIIGTGVNGLHLGQQTDNTANSSRLFYDNSTNIWTTYSTAGSFKIASGATIGTSSGTDRLVIDSSGNVLVGKSVTTLSTNGIGLAASGEGRFTRDGDYPLLLNRKTSDGGLVLFYKDGTTVGSIGCDGGAYIYIGSDSVQQTYIGFNNNYVYPSDNAGNFKDDAIDLGNGSAKFDDVYATNGTIQTSDRNEKQQIASLTSAEITAAKAISKLFKTFKWKSKVTSKGDNARTHTGVIAQDVQSAMTDAGLDAADYAFFCSDTWWETQTEVPAVEAVEAQDAVLDDDGNIVTEAVEAVEARDAYTRTDTYNTADEAPEGATERTRLGIRYPELLSFIGAATEQRLADLETAKADFEARLTALEAG